MRFVALMEILVAAVLVADHGIGAYQAILVTGVSLCMTMLPGAYFRHEGGMASAMWLDYCKWACSLLLLVSAVSALRNPSVLQAELVLFSLCGITGFGRPYRVAVAAVVALVASVGLWMAADPDLPWALLLLLGSSVYLVMEPAWARSLRPSAAPGAPAEAGQ